MNGYYQELLVEINRAPKHPPGNFKGKPFDLNKYLGTPHKLYFINTPAMQKIAKEWAKQHQEIPAKKAFDCLTELFKGGFY